MRYIVIIILAGLIFSCGNTNKNQLISKAEYIRILVKKAGFQQLPYSHDLNNDKESFNYSIDSNSDDTLIFNNIEHQIIGVLPDTSNYFGFLYYGVGDDLYPSLITFDKNGNKIDNKSVCIGQCAGIVEEYDTCIDKVTINKDLTIDLYYNLRMIQKTGDSIVKTDTICEQILGKGKITKDGIIIIEEGELENCK